jgi:hypothetical protein
MPVCEPFPKIHAPTLYPNHCRPFRQPPAPSAARNVHPSRRTLDCWAVGSLEVANPCCHRPTARHHLVVIVYQTGVCQSATPRPNMTQRQQYIHPATRILIIIPQTTWHCCCCLTNRWQFPLSPSNETKPTKARTNKSPLKNPPRNTSIFRKPKPAVSTLHHRPARSPFLQLRVSRPKEISHFLDLMLIMLTAWLGRIASSTPHACMPRRAERTTPTDHYHTTTASPSRFCTYQGNQPHKGIP